MNERALSLLKILGLENRAIYLDEFEGNRSLIGEPIDWAAVEERLDVKRREVCAWLGNVGL